LTRTLELISHPALGRLHPTRGHPERGERVAALLERFVVREGAAAEREAIERVHDPAYVRAIEVLEEEIWLDGDTVAGPTTWEAVLLATGCGLEAVERGGFALVRPPGHHAVRSRGMGFCIFNIAVVMARHALAAGIAERVAIVDWDVHHGNGTEDLVLGDPALAYASLHQWPLYPGTGGPGTSRANVMNVPLAAGSDDAAYRSAFRAEVTPFVTRFEPDLVVVSAGFDGYRQDPLAGMELTAAGFRELAAASARLGPRVAAVLEGGYLVDALPELVAAAIEGFENP
jgi:acetoin utilization deacetylase AcuC-like enzyme